ncbi:MAG: hypothetical protein KTR15_00440 [Phycisphaeraceae bacterium]|nr:hypothetical protein [Phycisphaeraceae bacterium]
MNVFGAPTAWSRVIDPIVPEILRLVVDTWRELSVSETNQREDDITNLLCIALRRNRELRELMFYVITQAVVLEPGVGEEVGRIDIMFLPTETGRVPSEEVYFCLECKRLNVPQPEGIRPYAAEYVRLGMMRFVTGQYAQSVQHGGMVGYVLDGNVSGAMERVEQNIDRQQQGLHIVLPATFKPSMHSESPNARETHHRRDNGGAHFCIHHLFVSAGTSESDM